MVFLSLPLATYVHTLSLAHILLLFGDIRETLAMPAGQYTATAGGPQNLPAGGG